MSQTAAQLKRNGTSIYQSTHTHPSTHTEETEFIAQTWAESVQIVSKDLIMTSSVWVYTSSCPWHNPQQPSIETRKKIQMLIQQEKDRKG